MKRFKIYYFLVKQNSFFIGGYEVVDLVVVPDDLSEAHTSIIFYLNCSSSELY